MKDRMKIRLPEFREATLALVLVASTVNAQAPPTCPPTCALPGQPGGPPPPGAPGGPGGGIQPGGPQQILMMQQLMRRPANPPGMGGGMQPGMGGGMQPGMAGGPPGMVGGMAGGPPGVSGGMAGGPPGMGGGMAGGPSGMGGGMAGGPPGVGGGAAPQSQPRSAEQGSGDRTGPGGAIASAETNRAGAGVVQPVASYVGPTNVSFVRPGNTATTRSFLSRSPLGNR